MLYLLKHQSFSGKQKTNTIISAFFPQHAKDILEFVVDIKDEDIVEVLSLTETQISDQITAVYEINNYNELISCEVFVASLEEAQSIYVSKNKKSIIKAMNIKDEITNIYKLTFDERYANI